MGNMLSTVPLPHVKSNDHILRLSEGISSNSRLLRLRLNLRGIEAASFGFDGSFEFPSSVAGPEATNTRNELIAQTKELHDLLVGPGQRMKNMVMEIFSLISIQAVCDFKVASSVPKDGSISYHDLSFAIKERTGMPVDTHVLRKLVRLAITNNIFCEPQHGFVAHNSSSLLLLEDDELSNFMTYFTHDMFAVCANAVSAMRRWPTCQEPNETGVNLAWNHKLNWFDHVTSDAGRAKRFETMLRANGSREGYEAYHTVDSFDWESLGESTVVDVGGSDGFVSTAIAKQHPALKFIVQDLPKTRTNIEGKVPNHLRNRVELTAHDCFTPQPEVAKVYFFRFVFHAFSDKYSISALRSLIPALQPGARVIINDLVLPTPGSLPQMAEKSIRTMDVMVQSVCNSTERELDDWKTLFEVADARYKWKGARKGTGKLWFIEAVWEP